MIYIIADDLTGANDTGVQYKKYGFRTLILSEIDLDLLDTLADNFDVISINSDTRTQLPQDAYNTTYELVKRIQAKEHKYIYKKIDSVLRGNVAQELDAVMDALDAPFAVVATSYPANGRTLCNGILMVSDANGVNAKLNVTRIFADGMSRKVQGIELATVRQGGEAVQEAMRHGLSMGVQVFVVDAVTDEDLAVVRDASLAIEDKAVFCGSAGLAKQLSLLETHDKQDERPMRKEDGVTLVVVGSHNACTAEQVQALSEETGMPVVTIFTSEILNGEYEKVERELLQQTDNLITCGCALVAIVVDTLFPGSAASLNDGEGIIYDSLKIAGVIGSITRQLCERYKISAILSSGGDTSLAIFKALGAKGIELDEEIVPGVPVGRLMGGMADGMTVVTKSGGFGKKDTLIRSIEYLDKEV